MKSGLARHGCAISIVGALLGVAAVILLAMVGPNIGEFVFSQLVWSPDGSHLAFGADSDYNHRCRLYVVDADGDNRRKLVDTGYLLDDECEELSDFRWAIDGTRIYFRGEDYGRTAGVRVHYYVVDIDGGKPQRLSEDVFLSVPVSEFPSVIKPDRSTSTTISTECDKAPDIGFLTTHPNGLIAQSVCYEPIFFGCHEKLQICDATTGKLVFTLDQDSLSGWRPYVEKLAAVVGFSLLVLSPLMLLLGGYLLLRQLFKRLFSPG